MKEDFSDQIEEIRGFPGALASVVSGLTVEQLTAAYRPDGWTVAQIVHHLADSHMNSYVRCKLMATEEYPTLRPYDENRWAQLTDASAADIERTLSLLSALHSRWAEFWESLSPDDWYRTGHHPADGDVTLADQLQLYVEHGRAHLEQIADVLATAPE